MRAKLTLNLLVFLFLCLGVTNVWADKTHYIAVASDRHGNTSAIGNAMSGMPDDMEYVSLNGDMVDNTNNYSSSTVLSEVNNVKTAWNNRFSSTNCSIVYGSHDASCNDDAGIMKCKTSSGLIFTGYKEGSTTDVAYYVYGISYSSMTSSSSTDAAAFKSWVADKDPSIPIIVICHVPLHYQRNDNQGAVAWSKALNYAATGEETTVSGKEIIRNVIFLHGHNHTSESNTEYFIPVGSTMYIYSNSSSNSHYIYYTYTTAGYLRDNTAATLIAIGDNTITLSKYKNGSVTSTYASTGAKTNFSNTYVTSATNTVHRVSQKPVPTMAPMDDMTANWEGTQFELTGTPVPSFTYNGEQLDLPVTYSSSNTDVATVDANGTVTITGSGTADITVAFAGNDTYGPVQTTYTINVSKTSTVSQEVYVLVNEFTLGKDYLIANGNSGTVTILGHSNENAKTATAVVQTINGKTYIETAGDEFIWTATAHPNSSYSSYPRLINSGYAVYPSSSSISFSNSLTATSGAVYTRYWVYESEGKLAGISTNSGSTKYYMVYDNDNSKFAASTDGSGIYIFEKQTISEVTETYTVTFDPNNGESVTTVDVEVGETAPEPTDPTKAGYTFAGWYLDGVAYDFTSPVTGNITLVAQWTEATTPSATVIYQLVSTMEVGEKYLIVGSGSAGNSNALTHTNGETGNDAVTIHAADATSNEVYINGEDVEDNSIWVPTTENNLTKIKNGEYYLQVLGSNHDLSASTTESTSYSNFDWSYSSHVLKETYTSGSSTRTKYLTYSSNAFSGSGNSSATIYLYKQIITAPVLTAAPASLDFETAIGTPVTQTFTVTGANLTSAVSVDVTGSGFTADATSITVAEATASSGKVVTVTFTPTTVGDYEGTITLSSTGVADVTVELTGTALQPVITAEPASVVFDAIVAGTTSQQTFMVTGENLSGEVGVSISGEGFSVDVTSISVAEATEGKTVTVTFAPTALADYAGTITLSSANAEDVVVALSGSVLQPAIAADPTSLTFDATEAGTSTTKTFTVTGENLSDDIALTLTDENNVFSIDNATISKDGIGDGIEVTVTFAPTAEGDYTGTITLGSENAESVTVTLNGTATKALPDYAVVNISSAGITTLYLDYPVEIPFDTYDELLSVSYVYGAANNSTSGKRLDKIVPANTGVIVAGGQGTYRFPTVRDMSKAEYERDKQLLQQYPDILSGCTETTVIANNAELKAAQVAGTLYTLQRGNEYILFQKFSGETLGANKCYLIYEGGSGGSAKTMRIFLDDETTAIKSINQSVDGDDTWYNLQGVRLSGKPSQKGVYIRNGQLVTIK